MKSEWKPDGFQLAWFAASPISASAADLYNVISTSPPVEEGRANHPETGPVSFAAGLMGDVSVRIQVQGGRVDAFIGAAPTNEFPPKFIAFERLEERLKGGIDRARNIGTALGKAHRLAIVVNLFHQQDSTRSANQYFFETIGITGTPPLEDASDLAFSMNYPTTTSKGVRVNRLLRWEVGAIVTMAVQAGVPRPASTAPGVLAALDVNTVPGSTVFSPEEGITILHELAEEVCKLINAPSLATLMDRK